MDNHSEAAIAAIEAYMETEGLEEEELYIDMQMDVDREDGKGYMIDYAVRPLEHDGRIFNPGFHYDGRQEAWEQYLDQIAEIYQRFTDAEIRSMHPDRVKDGIGGGNPTI